MRLLIISNMSHYLKNGQIVGWGPTVQEINALSTLFDKVHHLGCLHPESAPASALPYDNDNIMFIPVPPAGGKSFRDKLTILKLTPVYIRKIWKALNETDVVHLRCPANIPLLGLLLLIIRKRPVIRWAKYAGNWEAGPDYPFFYRLQRWILKQNFARCYVTVTGEWGDQKQHVITFNNPCLTLEEISLAKKASIKKDISAPAQLIFVGALNERKGAGRLLRVIYKLKDSGYPIILNILGDGQNRHDYEKWCKDHGIEDIVNFQGWIPKPALKNFYQKAHLNILPSESEGWPKVLGEGMAYGVVPVAGAVSSIPQMLNKTRAGVSIDPFDIDGFVAAIQRMIEEPEVWKSYSQNSIKYAPLFTYEHYLASVKGLFKTAWNVDL